MFKSTSLILSAVMVLLFVGCQFKPKGDAELIKDGYASAISGNESFTVVVDKSKLRDELKVQGVPDNYTYRITSKNLLMSEKYKNCTASFDKVYGDWATISQNCGNQEIDGISYMKKENGIWKVPVHE